jgi:hypothetical protein
LKPEKKVNAMIPFFWVAGLFTWLGAWILFAARLASRTEGDGTVSLWGKLGPAFVGSTWLIAFALVPARLSMFWTVTRIAHHFAISLLFLFLVIGQYFQAEAWLRVRHNGAAASIVAAYRRLWILTEVLPAPIAITILLTGLRLIWQVPDLVSPRNAWLLGVLLLFSLFFWDGILGFQPIVKSVYSYWQGAVGPHGQAAVAAAVRPTRWESTQLLFHLLSWPVVFVLALSRCESNNAVTSMIARLIDWLGFLRDGWPEVVAAVILWALTGLLVWMVRFVVGRTRQA